MVALKKLWNISGDLAKSRLSQPSGNPTATEGKSMIRSSIFRPGRSNLLIDLAIRGALTRVVIMATSAPREANNFAMSMAGIVWP